MNTPAASSGARNGEPGDLLALQARMKRDPPGYEQELILQLHHFRACVSILLLQNPLSSSSTAAGLQTSGGPSSAASGDLGATKEVADLAMFLSHVAPFYPQYLKELPQELLKVLDVHANLQNLARRNITQAVILLRNRKLVELVDILPILMDLQCGGDRVLRRLAFLHVVHDIRRMNLKHKDQPTNRRLQAILFKLLQGEDEVKAKRALAVLAELHRRKVWTDDRAASAICMACLHQSPRIMIAALRFLLGYDQHQAEEEGDDSDDSDMENEGGKGSVAVNREAMYKAYHKGTTSSKKKKQNKLQRAIRSMQKQQRAQSREMEQGSHVPLQHVVDPQRFAEELFKRLRSSNDRFEVKLMMMQVISRAVGMHRLMLLNFYPFLQKYIEPHQRDVTLVLSAAVQACHDLVPPDAVESMVRQLVNHFVHDRARPEVIAVGLNVMREICMRIPLVMTSELLTDLALYKKNREKAVAAAARSIISVYRQLWPSLLEKKDRGRNADLAARPKAFGARTVADGVVGAELLLEEDDDSDLGSQSGDDQSETGEDEDDVSDDDDGEELNVEADDSSDKDGVAESDSDDGEELGKETDDRIRERNEEIKVEFEEGAVEGPLESERAVSEAQVKGDMGEAGISSEMATKKRKASEPGADEEITVSKSLRSLKRLSAAQDELQAPTAVQNENIRANIGDGILSNEDFEHIRSLQAKRAAKAALVANGLTKAGKRRQEVGVKLSTPEALSQRRVNPAVLEANVRRRREKEERLAMAKAGREDREAYGSRTATKQKKTGGLSNREKEKRKAMPLGAVRSKVARNKEWKRIQGKRTNQFRGKKAWKC